LLGVTSTIHRLTSSAEIAQNLIYLLGKFGCADIDPYWLGGLAWPIQPSRDRPIMTGRSVNVLLV